MTRVTGGDWGDSGDRSDQGDRDDQGDWVNLTTDAIQGCFLKVELIIDWSKRFNLVKYLRKKVFLL